MAKKKKTRRRIMSGIKERMSKSSLLDSGVQIAEILFGVVLGTQAKKLVEKKDVVSGTDLLGLDGETSKFTTPLLVCVAGSIITLLAKNHKHARNIALGITVAGGAGLVNTLSGKSLVSLGDADDNPPVVLPGVGNIPMLPGIGDVDIPGIPTNYDYSLDPALAQQPVGDIENFAGDYDETDAESIAGIGLANII
jgi:hypothetical protein